MNALLLGVGVLVATGVLAALAGHRATVAGTAAVVGEALAFALGVPPCVRVLSSGAVESLRAPWHVPGGSFHVELDALAAFFILTILSVSFLCCIYGLAYMRAFAGQKRLGGAWCFLNILIASMILVVLARNAILFLSAWEVMAVASFFLVAFEDEERHVRSAAWTYLVATHLGTAALLLMFAILGAQVGSLDFEQFGGLGSGATHAVFVLALIGFGSKAGFAPFYVWLPEAHPAAPSHVSAIMSGLMIKTGIYGLIRILLVLGAPPMAWSWALIVIGLVSGVGGVLFALAQHDLKRLLAYSSVENIGIIALGLALGLAGWTAGMPVVSVLGFAGGILHVLNHSLFKSLLFLGAGAVQHAMHTRDMNRLAGLLRQMPRTGLSFLVGAAAISGLPPLNGFVSEFLIFMSALSGITSGRAALVAPSICVIAGLALISGLATACFTKAFGCVFLGAPRATTTHMAHDPHGLMQLPMFLLAAACVVIGFGAPWIVSMLAASMAVIRPGISADVPALLETASIPLLTMVGVFVLFVALAALIALARSMVLRGRIVSAGPTWDCGYAVPTARMQYTASSFTHPLTRLFRTVLRTRRHNTGGDALLPAPASLTTETPDICTEGFYRPLFSAIGFVVFRLRVLQHGNIHLYILYIAVTLLSLLIWEMT